MVENELKQLYTNNHLTPYFQNMFNQEDIRVVPEIQFINGITADFCVYNNTNNEILSVIECKGDDIGVTEYVRGIGQILQYQYFKINQVRNNINPDCRVFLSFPSSLIDNSSFDITQFAYPTNTELLIVNSLNYAPTKINPTTDPSYLLRSTNTIQISPYYFRDIRIFEMYIILLELLKVSKATSYSTKISRTEVGKILAKYNTTNKGNSRNVFIALSSLGLITENNHLTQIGYQYSKMPIHEFITNIIFEYYYPYINIFFRAFDRYQQKNDKYILYNMSNSILADYMREFYNNKDILFVTESNNRYISSWLNCLKDDLLCVEFPPSKQVKNIIIKYNPLYSKEQTKSILKTHFRNESVKKYLSEY